MNRAMLLSAFVAVLWVSAARAQSTARFVEPFQEPSPTPIQDPSIDPSAVPDTPQDPTEQSPETSPPRASFGTTLPSADRQSFEQDEPDFGGSPLQSIIGDEIDLTPKFQLRGRIEAEAVRAVQSEQSKATIGDLQNGYGFRRFRVGVAGTVGDAARWVSEVELAGNNVRLRDVFVSFLAAPYTRQIRVGQYREPFSLEAMTSTNFITFLERSPSNVINPARSWGVCGYWQPEDDMWLFTLGVFRDGTQSSGQSIGDEENWAYTGRLTGLLIYEPDPEDFQLFHLGGAFSQRTPPNDTINFTPATSSNLITVEDNPGSPFLPSVILYSDSYQLGNLQAAYVNGPFSIQSEWQAANVQQLSGGPVFAYGAYLFGSYFLTGEHRSYSLTRGSFTRIDVLRPVTRSRQSRNRGNGAYEAIARVAYFNMDSPNLPLDINGDPAQTRLFEMSFGLNWYLNSNLRVMFDYTCGMPDNIALGSTVAHIFGVRTALHW